MQYTVQAAARATGVSESRLRTWERRYGIPKPRRSPTGRRLYEEEDLALIRRMASLVASGIPAAQAAEAARTQGGLEAQPAPPEPLHPSASALVEATGRFDDTAAVRAIRSVVDDLGWGAALDRAVFPALEEIGTRWQRGEIAPAHEHFASELVRRELAAEIVERSGLERSGPRVLLACVEDERHDLGLLALWLMLLGEQLHVIYLGADVPTVELLAAAARLEPEGVVLAATAGTSLPMLAVCARAVIAERLPLRLFVGGPALRDPRSTDVPGVRLSESVIEAAATVASTLRSA